MVVSRRRLLTAAAMLPVLAAARFAVELAGEVIATVARSARPAASGTSATRCAQCGASDHAMLDPSCRLAPRVLG